MRAYTRRHSKINLIVSTNADTLHPFMKLPVPLLCLTPGLFLKIPIDFLFVHGIGTSLAKAAFIVHPTLSLNGGESKEYTTLVNPESNI